MAMAGHGSSTSTGREAGMGWHVGREGRGGVPATGHMGANVPHQVTQALLAVVALTLSSPDAGGFADPSRDMDVKPPAFGWFMSFSCSVFQLQNGKLSFLRCLRRAISPAGAT